jgi:hypothetical protein
MNMRPFQIISAERMIIARFRPWKASCGEGKARGAQGGKGSESVVCGGGRVGVATLPSRAHLPLVRPELLQRRRLFLHLALEPLHLDPC